MSVGLVYLILAAQFESVRLPLVVLAAVPLAAGGVVAALEVAGQSLNLMSLTGCAVLVGIVVNDAILKVELIRRLERGGLPLGEAVRLGSRTRFRPVIMTTATTVLGLLPLAFGWGGGGSVQAPLAIAVVGGLVSSTALTLWVVPALYVAVSSSRGATAQVAAAAVP